MNIIGMCAFGTSLSVSFFDGRHFYENMRMIGLKHNQILLPQVEQVLSEAGKKAGDIEMVVCSQGPGSFTALRILLSTAKGLAAGSKASFLTIPTFHVIARAFGFFPGVSIPVIDAKRNRFYTAFYSEGTPLSEAMDLTKEQIIKRSLCYDPVLLIGEDVKSFGDYIDNKRVFASETVPSMGKHLIERAVELYKEGNTSPEDASPLYVRESDAELNKKRKNG